MASRVLIVGSGAIGLRTALELLRKKIPVSLWSPRHPLHPSTCSMGAGGLWMPYHCDDERVDRWAVETLDELLQNAAGSPGSSMQDVEIVPAVALKRSHHGPTVDQFANEGYGMDGSGAGSPLPAWTTDRRIAFQHLTVEMLSWQNEVHQLRIPSLAELIEAGYLHAWLFRPPVVDAPRMLQSMLTEIELNPYTIDVDVETGRYFSNLQEMVGVASDSGFDVVVNCTGLGARTMCNDGDLVGGRGVLLHFARNCERREDMHGGRSWPNDAVILVEESPWGSELEPCYMIPRGDTIVVGGTYLENDNEPSIRTQERERLMRNARMLGIDTKKASVSDEWVGFRPSRPSVRLEIDRAIGLRNGIKVVHNYGHGGSGWTVFVGAAKEVASLLEHGD